MLGLGLGLGLTPREGGALWSVTKTSLKSYLGETAGTPNAQTLGAMASPPIITAGTSLSALGASNLTLTYAYAADAARFRFSGGGVLDNGFGMRQFPVATVVSGGNTAVSTLVAGSWRVGMQVNARKVALRLRGTTGKAYRFRIDGQYADLNGTIIGTSGAATYALIDFGAKAFHLVEVEGEQGFHAFMSASIDPGDTLVAPTVSPYSVLALGDSVAGGTGADWGGGGLISVLADYFALDQRWASGSGGTGYIATNGGAGYKLRDRLVADIGRMTALGIAPEIVIVAVGLNDISQSGVQDEAALCLDMIRTLLPRALVFVLGAWDVNAPSAPVAGYAACKSAIEGAIGSRGGMWFVDPQGQSYTKADGVHPNAAGHLALAQWLATTIRSLISA